MKEQNYRNHARIVFTYHVFTGLAILALIIGAVRNLIQSDESNLYSASLLVLVSVVVLSLYIHTRSFALKAQDRAIRAEENLRHFTLTGKLLDPRLSVGQVVALRFATDGELVALAQKAAEQNLSPKAIKQEIRSWRADHHRV